VFNTAESCLRGGGHGNLLRFDDRYSIRIGGRAALDYWGFGSFSRVAGALGAA
jgi:hypothetical protein